jgi:hypothetical protein
LIKKGDCTSGGNIKLQQSDKNTHQYEESDKDQEQNESSVDAIQDAVSSTQTQVFCHENSTQILKHIGGAEIFSNGRIITNRK